MCTSDIVVDVPAIITGADIGTGGDADSIRDPDTGTYIAMPYSSLGAPSPLYLYVQYGDGPNRLNWSLPDGATIVSIEYVVKAYREADVAFAATPVTGWTPAPTANPWLSMEAADRVAKLAIPELVVTTSWSDAEDELSIADPDPTGVVEDDQPMDKMTAIEWSTSSIAVVQCAYLAARVTFRMGGA